jgi:DNA-binding CsgD family transcriptional regulator
MRTVPARPGLIVVDESLSVVGVNAEALRILTFPDPAEKNQRLDARFSNRVRSIFIEKRPPFRVINEFRSDKRTYVCRSFPLGLLEHQNGSAKPVGSTLSAGMMVVILERVANEAMMIGDISPLFGLTSREQQTVKFLLEGLTSKEIAERMQISPNTVKAFIRLVMVKMNVSTRSGIIGKIVGSKAALGLLTRNSNGASGH